MSVLDTMTLENLLADNNVHTFSCISGMGKYFSRDSTGKRPSKLTVCFSWTSSLCFLPLLIGIWVPSHSVIIYKCNLTIFAEPCESFQWITEIESNLGDSWHRTAMLIKDYFVIAIHFVVSLVKKLNKKSDTEETKGTHIKNLKGLMVNRQALR